MEAKLKDKIATIYCKWEEHIELRFAYASGGEIIPVNTFPSLFQATFELIRQMNNNYIYEGKSTSDASVMMDYLSLLTFVSKYVVYDSVEDNSFNKYFTVTSVIAEKLLSYATRVGCYSFPDNNTVVYRDEDEEHRGIFEFWCDDYPPFDCDYNDRTKHIYKIYFPDFSDMVALAQKMS